MRTNSDRAVFASLREIHTAAHQWQLELTATLAGSLDTPERKRAAIAEQRRRAPQVAEIIVRNLTGIRTIFDGDILEHEWGAEMLVGLELGWKDIENHWSPDPAQPDAAIESLKAVRGDLDQIVFSCLDVTLSPDINDRLPNLGIGQPFDVEFVFGDGFPLDTALRQRLLVGLAQEQGAIDGGVYDPASGLVYRIAPTAIERSMSVWRIALLILAGAVLAAGSCFLGPLLPGWRLMPNQWRTVVANYAMLFVGAAGHLVIDGLKQKRAQTKPAFSAMDDWLLWLHVRERSVIYSILYADLGFILLTAAMPNFDWTGALAAGYSIDSITDLFLARFETAIGEAAKKLS